MLQPVNLQLAHFNVEHSAQISKEAMAAAQQTGQTRETVQENVRRAQRVEASIAAAEAQKIKRREDEKNRRGGQQYASSESDDSENDGSADNVEVAVVTYDAKATGHVDKPIKSVEFYA
ncbi:hypothetical protein AGMMS50276_07960 [Synergistales bacterium]|nr:hypothetical protein AGMMS50276_07960 [Synergistales bacterium]